MTLPQSRVTVAMPWRATPSRIPPYRRVKQFWADMGLPVIPADSDTNKPFNRAQARNRAVASAPPGIVIVADADTIPAPQALKEALATVQDEVVWPFTWCRRIPGDWTGDLESAPDLDADAEDLIGMGQHAVGGVLVMRTSTWWRLGGMDERFTGWGGEDTAFACAANTLTGTRRIPGVLTTFDHFMDGEVRAHPPAGAWNPYRAADGIPAAMEALIADPSRMTFNTVVSRLLTQ